MANLNITSTRTRLQNFEFHELFIEELGWSQPAKTGTVHFSVNDLHLIRTQIAHLGGAVVFEITAADGCIPPERILKEIYHEIAKSYHENLIIFVDAKRTQSIWYWVKREYGKRTPRKHYYFKGQPGDLFLSKLSAMVVDMADLDENGDILITEAADRLKKALDIETTVKKFYNEYKDQRLAFTELITGINDEHDKKWYASIILNRLMFIYFLQGKGFLNNGDYLYLQNKLGASVQIHGKNKFYTVFLQALFFEGFAKPEHERTQEAKKMLGSIKYLNGGLFLPHRIEIDYKNIDIPDRAFENLLNLFKSYSWNLDDTPGGNDGDMNPDVLGYIFEKYINQKAFGAYYTRPEITEYLCERTIYKLVLDRINDDGIPGVLPPVHYKSISELLMNLDANLCRRLLNDILPNISLLDPACGSGAFLVAAMKTLINLYSAVIGKIEFLNDKNLKDYLLKTRKEHPSINYYIKKRIITDNLYGVDIMDEATEIARLRLFLALVASAASVEELEPLPNIDFNIMAGNSLIGLLKIDQQTFDESGDLIAQSYYHTYTERLSEKQRLLDTYRHASTYADDLRTIRDEIEKKDKEVCSALNQLLLDQFGRLGIRFEQATWDDNKNKEGRSKKRTLTIHDIEKLKPFHWGYEFDEILNTRGGFDAVITNPPWEVFQTDEKEFFQRYDTTIQKKKLRIEDWKKQHTILMKDCDIRHAWLDYVSEFSFVSGYFKSIPQFKNQISIVNGRTAGGKLNLCNLFTEQCFNLLKFCGECGIVIPSGIYTDMGTKQLREMLFENTKVTGLFCFENRKEIFENVDSRFKFVVLTYKKGETTKMFPAKFMRHDVAELEHFPGEGAINIHIDLIKKLSPDSISIMEFKNEEDMKIAEKLLKWPLLGDDVDEKWKLKLTQEFNMTTDSDLFETKPHKGALSLFTGKMFHQFEITGESSGYWIDEESGRKRLQGRNNDSKNKLDYQNYRWVHRRIASNTNERTLITTITPKNVFTEVNSTTIKVLETGIQINEMVFLTAITNSFVVDWMLRQKVTTTLNMFYIYQLPVPRLTAKDKIFPEIVSRAARLICTTPEFDELAKEVGLGSHKNGVTDPVERTKLRAELDGIIAHLYELTEDEFKHVLSVFPIVAQPVKDAALEQYRVFGLKAESTSNSINRR